MRALNVPIHDVESLTPKEKLLTTDDQESTKVTEDLTREEKRKIDKDEKQRKKIEADLEPERLLREEIDLTKRTV